MPMSVNVKDKVVQYFINPTQPVGQNHPVVQVPIFK